MVDLLLLLFCPLVAAESFVYLHPVNPKLHPRDMYPIQKSFRGSNKVRDLPSSGIVYINRIKPISEEFKGAVARADNTLIKETAPAPLKELEIEPTRNESEYNNPKNDHNAEDTAAVMIASSTESVAQIMDSAVILPIWHPISTQTTTTKPSTMSTIRRTTTKEMEHLPYTKKKNVLKIAISKTSKNSGEKEEYDLSREAQIDLEHLISQIKQQEKVDLIEESNVMPTIVYPTISSPRTRNNRHGDPSAKLISLSRTASVHEGEMVRKPSMAKLVHLKKKKSFGRVGAPRRGSDFDPWERIGQK